MPATIRLTVPGTLRYRAIAVRVVAEAARLVSSSGRQDPKDPFAHDVKHPFDTAVVSAFMEIFNNVAIHAYQRREDAGSVDIEIAPRETEIVIEVRDAGRAFDIDAIVPLPVPSEHDDNSLPEGGMGIHIAKTMLDEMTYEPGPPNRWRLRKCLLAPAAATGTGRS